MRVHRSISCICLSSLAPVYQDRHYRLPWHVSSASYKKAPSNQIRFAVRRQAFNNFAFHVAIKALTVCPGDSVRFGLTSGHRRAARVTRGIIAKRPTPAWMQPFTRANAGSETPRVLLYPARQPQLCFTLGWKSKDPRSCLSQTSQDLE